MPGLHATWSRSCVGDKRFKLYTHFCCVETDEDLLQGLEALLTSNTEHLADSPQQISLSDYEDSAPESSPRVGVVTQATPTSKESQHTNCLYFVHAVAIT